MADDGYPYPGTSQISTADEWEGFFSAAQLDGVVGGLVPSLNSGARTASVGVGGAYLRGFFKPVTSSTATAVPAASGQDRVDRLVLRLDRDAATAATYIVPTVLTGTAGAATPPTLTQGTTGTWDLPISRWTSKSNGSLSGLVDERYGPTWTTSAARAAGLVPAAPPRVMAEVDTGRVFRSDGSVWTLLWEDLTAEAALTPTSNWDAAGPCQVNRSWTGLVEITLNLIRTNTAFYGGTDVGSPLAQVPSIYRPLGHTRFSHAHITPNNQARVRIETDGWIYADNPTLTVGVGRALRITFVYTP